jgi:hypothetical protein
LDSQPQIAAHSEHRMERRSAESDGVVVVVVLFLSIPQVGLWEETKFVAVVAVVVAASWLYLYLPACHPSLTRKKKKQNKLGKKKRVGEKKKMN